MKDPTNGVAKILQHLILNKEVNLFTFKGSGLRARISDLRKLELNIASEQKFFVNEFGRDCDCANYVLKSKTKIAMAVYDKINK